jgi:phosphomannomutase
MRNELLISISGIRGVVGESLTPQKVLQFACAFGEFCQNGKIILGRDTRISGEMYRDAVVSGLISLGCQVIDLGIVPTPTVAMAVEEEKAAGGIVITASHNPIEWNALKFIGNDGIFLSENDGKKVIQKAKENKFNFKPWNKLGKVEFSDIWTRKHIQEILKLKLINPKLIRTKHFRVVIDSNNGAGSIISPFLLENLGCQVFKLNCQPTGLFSHSPEPVQKNLKQLCQAIKKFKADIGFATDPDVDRLAIVSEKGIPLGEELTLALATDLVLRKKKGNVAVNLSTSRIIEDIAKKYDCQILRTRVGEAHVARELKKVRGIIGGEGNGGVILPELHYGRDALVGMALLLQYLAEENQTLSELREKLPHYFMIKTSFPLKNKFELKKDWLKKEFPHAKLNNLDGIKLEAKDFWVQIRKSNTEPIVRIIAEGKNKKEAEALIKKFKNCLS